MTPVPCVPGPACAVPVATAAVHAGFPSPAEDHAEDGLDLSRRFVRHPTASFIVRAAGQSLEGIGIRSGDYLLVDRSRRPQDGDVVVAVVDGDFVAKVYRTGRPGGIVLESAHPGFAPIPWRDGCAIWGVVSSVHRDLLQHPAG